MSGDVTVLLATYNGARWLDRQLGSVLGQHWAGAINVLALDDGSTDGTLAVLAGWQRRWGRGEFVAEAGPCAGHSANFRQLVLRARTGSDFFAFCDQDDVWLPQKLALAAAAIGDRSGPALHGTATTLVDADENVVGRSPTFRRAPAFRNALVQNIAGGNTMVMNAAALELIRQGCARTAFLAHDWFSYLLVSGAGGRVSYADAPTVLYRQHGANAVGAQVGPRATFDRLRRLTGGAVRAFNDQNEASLRACQSLLSEEARTTFDTFAAARRAPLPQRLGLLRSSGVYRQTTLGQAGLYLGAILGTI